MAFMKTFPAIEESSFLNRGLPQLPRVPSFPFYDKISSSSTTSPTTPLPGMSVFSNKRRYSEADDVSLPLPPLKMPKLISEIPMRSPVQVPPPISTPLSTRGHTCASEKCQYCSELTSLDIAAFYWSMLAMRGQGKKSPTLYETAPHDYRIPSPQTSPTSINKSFDLTYKPPSPSGSLSSLDSEPLSPSNSVISEASSTATTKSNGAGHISTTSKYQCQVCHKSYSHPRLLNRHLQSHTPYKKHHCPRCRKGFNDAFDLKRHIRTHTGIKPFHCDLCEKSFTQRCSLEAHMTRVHNVVHKFAFRERRPKLFVCEECGITFADNNKFRQHEKETHQKHN